MSSEYGQFRHQNRLLALEYATPRRQYTMVQRHRPWAGDVIFIVGFFACVFGGLFAVTVVAHYLIGLVML